MKARSKRRTSQKESTANRREAQRPKQKKLKDAITKTRKVFFGVVGTRNQRKYRTGSQDIIDFVVVATSTTECDSGCVDRLATTRLGKAYSQMRCRRSLRRCLGRARAAVPRRRQGQQDTSMMVSSTCNNDQCRLCAASRGTRRVR